MSLFDCLYFRYHWFVVYIMQNLNRSQPTKQPPRGVLYKTSFRKFLKIYGKTSKSEFIFFSKVLDHLRKEELLRTCLIVNFPKFQGHFFYRAPVKGLLLRQLTMYICINSYVIKTQNVQLLQACFLKPVSQEVLSNLILLLLVVRNTVS